MRNHTSRILVVTFCALALAACPSPRPPPDPVATPPASALALTSSAACAADADCASGLSCFQGSCVSECGEGRACADGESCRRGRCFKADVPAAPEAAAQLAVTNVPEGRFFAAPGQAAVTLRLELSAPVPEAGLAYRIERSDDPQAGATLSRAKGTGSVVELSVPVGAADPQQAGAKTVDTVVYTSVGRFNVRIEPAVPAAGAYAGSIALLNLGAVPVELQLVTEPADAPLATATSAWLVLEVEAASFLSPQAPSASVTKLAAPLTFDSFSNKYVARFDHAWSLAGSASRVFPSAEGQVGRGLRFELEQGPNATLVGNVVDVWSGLYELQGTGGVPAPETTYQLGTLDARRVGPGLTPAEATALPSGVAPAQPMAAAAPPLDACTSAVMTTFSALAPCAFTGSSGQVAAFEAATAADRAACAKAAVTSVLSADTITSKLAQYTSSTPPASGTFKAFLEDCRQGTNGTCVPTAGQRCARQLAAHAYTGLDADPTAAEDVLRSYLEVTREVVLGPQLAAFWADYQARLQWVQVDGAPAVIASALTSDSVARLEAWKTAVLDRHFATLAVQLDRSARAVFARLPADASLASARLEALMFTSQSWRGAADSLTFLARRWNLLLQARPAREQAAAETRERARDLYLVAAVVTGLSQSNGSLATAPFRGTFSTLLRAIGDLGLPFENLVFARDAEVVVSTSLDPQSSTSSILSQRRTAAQAALATATTQVAEVIDGVVADGLNELQFSAALATEVAAAQADLQRLCGLPPSCTVSQLGTTPVCAPRVQPGQCGFKVDQQGAVSFEPEIDTSRAGAQVLEVRKAAIAMSIAVAARDAHRNTVSYSEQNLAAFAQSVLDWNQKRQDGLAEMRRIFEEQNALQDQALATLIRSQAEAAKLRQESIASGQEDLQHWNRIKLEAADTAFDKLAQADAFATASSALSNAAEVTEFMTDGLTDPTKIAAYLVGGSVSLGLRAGSVALDALGRNQQLSAERVQTYAALRVEALEAQADLGGAIDDAKLAELQAAIDRAQGLSETQLAALNRALEAAREQRAAELAFARDLAELNDKRLAHFALVQQLPRFALEVDQAALAVQQRVLEYQLTVQDAQLAEARRALLQAQFTDANSLLGSPAVVFSRVNRLERADLFMQTARDRMMDWLTALEYLAVRPFVDHRMRILLARNPLQLERVALSLEELQNTCGGNTSQASLDVSVRDTLLGLDQPIVDVDGAVLSPAERFRAMLQRGSVPIDRRVRYRSDQTVGGLLSRQGGVLAASFSISLDGFANLALACNAKMVGFEVQLVGALGSGLPVVTVLYDGTSQVRSCQPDINAYVQSIGGPKWTNFGEVTLFKTAGRGASPNAGINQYLEGSNANVTLDGLPLASEYTLLIDTEAGDNARLDWSKLEDVRLRLKYGYQDLFAAGQCRE